MGIRIKDNRYIKVGNTKMLRLSEMDGERITLILDSMKEETLIWSDITRRTFYDCDKISIFDVVGDQRKLRKEKLSIAHKNYIMCVWKNEVCGISFGKRLYEKIITPYTNNLFGVSEDNLLDLIIDVEQKMPLPYPSFDASYCGKPSCVSHLSEEIEKKKDYFKDKNNHKRLWYNNTEFVEMLEEKGYSVVDYKRKLRLNKLTELGL